MMQAVASGNTKALKNIVEAVCAEAQENDDGMVDINVKSPSKRQRKEASQLDPGMLSAPYSNPPYMHFFGTWLCILTDRNSFS